jgi:hypothetical protein
MGAPFNLLIYQEIMMSVVALLLSFYRAVVLLGPERQP